MASKGRLVWDEKALRSVTRSKAVAAALAPICERTAGVATALGSPFRTGVWHDYEKGETRGPSSPRYASNVEDHGRGPVGLVWTDNYAAMRDTQERNTLLKAVR